MSWSLFGRNKYVTNILDRIVNPLRCFEAPGYGITCFCWRTENNVTVGTDNGSIAEFDISDTSDYGMEPIFDTVLNLYSLTNR